MANGLFAGGDGTTLNPYLIEDVHDLNAIRNGVSKHYKLISNIDLDITPYNVGEGWIPIVDFAGTLDGAGFNIMKLYTNTPTLDDVGLFGSITTVGKIRNLGLTNIDVLGNKYVGGLVGRLPSAERSYYEIENILITGNVRGNSFVGGLTGFKSGIRYAPHLLFKNIKVKATVQGVSNVGGVCGLIEAFLAGSRTSKLDNILFLPVDVNSLISYDLIGRASRDLSLVIRNHVFGVTDNVSNISQVGTLLTTSKAKTAQTFIDAGWNTELNEEGNPVWILEDGEYPKLWFEANPQYYLLKQDSKILTIESDILIETNLVEPLTRANFEELGFDNLNLLNNKNLTDLELLINPPTGTTVSTINARAVPFPQLILPNDDIKFRITDEIETFEILSESLNELNIKIVFSVDSGLTWKTYSKNELLFEEIDIANLEEVKLKGMDIETFNSIGLKWNDVIENNKIRFGYYLEMENVGDVTNIDRLDATIDMQGSWKSAEQGVDYNYGYGNEKVIIRLYRDGSYKVNYN